MLQVLAELIHGKEICRRASNPSLEWTVLSDSDFLTAFPFWATVDIRRVQNSLQNLGLIVVDPIAESRTSFFAIDDPSSETANSNSVRVQPAPSRQPEMPQIASETPTPSIPSSGSASLIAPNWQPSLDWIKKCQQHNVPEEFVNALIPEFVSYWRDRDQARFSWGNAFYKHVLKERSF